MSNWINWRMAVVRNRELSFGAKGLALYLNTFMNDRHDFAFPSIAMISGEMNISNKTAIKYLTELESSGMLAKEKRYGKSIIYHALVPSNVTSTLVEELHHSSVDSPLTVVEDLHTNKQKNKQKNKQEGFALPPEVDPDAWKDYCEHRESSAAMRKGWSKTAKTKAANKLAQFSHADQRAMVDKSVISGWTGLFEERNNGQNSGSSARNKQLNQYLDDIIAKEEYGKGAI